MLTPQERAVLLDYLTQTGLSGDTRTPRESVVVNAEKLAAGDPDKFLGLGAGGLDAVGVMEAVAALCGCSSDLGERTGPGVIHPQSTLGAIEQLADRLALAGAQGERLLICTGHPTGVMPMYQRIARVLEEAGAKILTPADNEHLGLRDRRHGFNRVRYLDGVAAATDGAHLYHTHESWPMEHLLARAGAEGPDLVLADHGFAGAAIAARIETLSFTDVNDPALCVAWAQGRTRIVVPIDDNRPPAHYAPLAEFLERAIRRTPRGGTSKRGV